MKLVNKRFPTGSFRNVDAPFRKYYTDEKEIMNALTLTENAPHKS